MAEPDLHERDPRQRHGDEEERRGDDFGGAGAFCRGLGRAVVVVMGVVRGMGIVNRMIRVMVVGGLRAGEAPGRAVDRDRAGEDRAEQGQEDDRLIHGARQPFIRLMSSTAIEPRLRK